MLSKRAKYALKALLALTEHKGDEPVRIADLAARERIPPKFLELILLDLRNQGMVQSRKGKRGGYLLARDPSRIPVGQVVRLFDGPLAPVPCASQTGYVRCDWFTPLRRLRGRGGVRRTARDEGSAGRDGADPGQNEPGDAGPAGTGRGAAQAADSGLKRHMLCSITLLSR